MARVAIFDYGAGNIFSLRNALERLGATVDVQTEAGGLEDYDGIFLPGVGNFDPAMRSIGARSDFCQAVGDTPVFGICLGMEMFFERSQEGRQRGLGVIAGEVIALPDTMKVPHMGWNGLRARRQEGILDGIPDGSWVYFVHSYMARPASGDIVVAESDYGMAVPAVIQKDNYVGTQFHPEKSGSAGARILKNFLRGWCSG